jgi:capsular exopolysaccharide synthesis family protein
MDSNEVKLHFLDYWRVIRVRWGLIALVFLLVVISATVTVSFLPKEYFAKVTMEVKSDENRGFNPNGGGSGFVYNPQFVATQFQILRKTEILYPVIDQLQLIKAFSGDGPQRSKQEVFNMVVGDLDMQEVRNTSLIEVGVWNTDPVMASNIANTIAVVYRSKRLEDLQSSLERSLQQYTDEVKKQEKLVTDAAVELAKIRVRDQINDPDPDNPTVQFTAAGAGTGDPERAVLEQRLKVKEAENQIQTIEKLKPEELISVYKVIGITDDTITSQMPILQQLVAEEANMLNSGIGERHPRVNALRAKKAAINGMLAGALETLRKTQGTRLVYEKEKLASLEENYQSWLKKTIDERNSGSNYAAAKATYNQAKRILANAQDALSKARMEKVVDIEPVKIRQKAEPPVAPGRPAVTRYILLSCVIGLIVGIALAFFIEYLDTSVKTLEDLEKFLQLPVLAVIPRGIPMLIRVPGEHPDTEAYRIMKANLEFNKPTPDAKTVTMISAGPGEGKSTTLNNLAFTCAKAAHYNVLVVDADLRRPAQHTFFETDNSLGLADFLQGKATIDQITRPTKIDNLSFIPAGKLPEDTAGILSGPLMKEFINQVRGEYDMIFFDSPPILGVSDGSVLASVVDMVVIVVQHRRFPRNMLQRVKHAVTQVGGATAGVVLNNVDTRHDEGYSYYNAYQDYYAPKRGERRPAATPAVAAASKANGHAPVAAPPVHHNDDGADY